MPALASASPDNSSPIAPIFLKILDLLLFMWAVLFNNCRFPTKYWRYHSTECCFTHRLSILVVLHFEYALQHHVCILIDRNVVEGRLIQSLTPLSMLLEAQLFD